MNIKENSIITCPHCGHQKDEIMPTNSCQFFYICEECKTRFKAKDGDCCVYCSYGDTPCPSIQEKQLSRVYGKDWKKARGEELVCYCIKVDKQTIVDAIKSGSSSLSAIKETTKACTGTECKTKNPGGKCCSVDINKLIALYGPDENSENCNSSCCCG